MPDKPVNGPPDGGPPVKILHVDDDEGSRYAVTRSLRKAGFEVVEAATGQQALDRVVDKPDLVVLDVRLPDVDGFEVCRRIKADPATADVPVLHLSASFTSGSDKATGLDAGADAYLVRPVEPVELVATVNALLRQKRAEDALRASEARFRFLADLGEHTRDLADPEAVMAAVARRLGEHLRASRCAYADVEPDAGRFTIRHDYTAPGVASTAGDYRLDSFGPRAADDMRHGRTLVVRDVDRELPPADGADTFNAIGIKAVVCCGLVKGGGPGANGRREAGGQPGPNGGPGQAGRLVAMMAVHQTAPRDWTAAEVRLVEEVVERSWAYIERARSRRALAASDERFRQVIEGVRDYAIFTMDPAGVVNTWNDGAERVTGYAEAEIVGRSAALIFTEEDRAAGVPEREMATAARDGQAPDVRWHRRKNGTRFFVDGVLTAVRNEAGAVVGYSKLMRDVTDRYEADRQLAAARAEADRTAARLRAVVGSMHEGLVVADAAGNLLEWNPAALALHGFASLDEARGRLPDFGPVFALSTPDGAAVPLADWPMSRVLAGETFAGRELVIRRTDTGIERVIDYSGTPVRDATGAVVLAVLTQHDVTDRRRAEAALRASEERYRTLFTSIDDGFCIVQVLFDAAGQPADYRFVEANPAFAAATGLERAVGRTALEMVPGLDRWWVQTYGRVAVTGEPVRFENHAEAMGGRWFDVYAFRFGLPENRQVAIFFKNVTARKRAEARATFLARLSQQLATAADPAEINAVATREVGEFLGAHRCYFFEVSADGDRVTVLPDWRRDGPDLAGTYDLAAFGTTEWRAVAARGPIGVDDVRADPLTAGFAASYAAVDVRAYANVPILRDGRWVAGVAASADEPRAWSADELALLENVVARAWPLIERARTAAALRESERRLRLAQRAGGVGAFEWLIADGRIVWSPELEALYGLEPGAFEGSLDHWRRRVEPADADHVVAGIEACLRDRRPEYAYEFRAILPNGTRRWLAGQAAFEYDPADGRPLRMIGVNVDVDARKRIEDALRDSERRFRDMADAAPAMLWITDPDGRCTFLSRGWYEYTGQTEADGLGLGWTSAAHPDDRAAAGEAFLAAHAAREPYAVDFRVRRADGAYRWVIDAGRPRFDAGGAFLGFIGAVIDIHDRKVAEQERQRLFDQEREARAAAENANRLKDEFLATLSHELWTPLNAIVGWASVLGAMKGHDADLAEGISAIDRNARVQAQLIEDLLDVSRIISGKLRLDVQRVELAPVVEAAVASVMPAARNKEVRLQQVLDPSAATVWGDPARLQQVVWNLLSNAIKFSPKDGRVLVAVSRVNSHVDVVVSDTGKGIGPQFLPYVFERFRQQDASTTRRHGGLGLGLAIVKHLVELHGGTVRADSPGEGQGATFTVRLPLTVLDRTFAPGEAVHPRAEAAGTRPAGGAATNNNGDDICPEPTLDGLRVLIVEDEPDARHLLRRFLEQCDAAVTAAGSAREALTALAGGRFDVIVSDIGMPEQDGYELIRRVRELPPDQGGRTPAVALTAFAHSEDRRRALMAGFQIHVPKPVDPRELMAVVAGVAGRTGRG